MPCGWDSIDGFIFNTVYLLARKTVRLRFHSSHCIQPEKMIASQKELCDLPRTEVPIKQYVKEKCPIH